MTAPLARHTYQSSIVDRNAELARLVPLWPAEITDLSIAGRRRIVALLGSALRRERQRGIAGHWTYDVSRHAALARMLRAETGTLRSVAPRMAKPAPAATLRMSQRGE